MQLALARTADLLESLWQGGPVSAVSQDEARLARLPLAAQRYVRRSLAPGTPVPMAVRLRMEGTIRLGGRWHPFEAEQVSRWGQGFLWRATSRVRGLRVSGYDRLVHGAGRARWRMLGMLPVASGSGPDITRSAAGRMNAEGIWLPNPLLRRETELLEARANRLEMLVHAHGDHTRIWLELDETGGARRIGLSRWGDPDGTGFRYVPFGGLLEEDRSFGGVTIPTRVRMGWHFGTERFEQDGEFFRAEILSAEFR